MAPSLLSFALLALAPSIHAAHLQLSGMHRSALALDRRTSMTGTVLNDTQNIFYSTNITLNGEQLSVMIDTGSSDLWVSKEVPNANDQNFQAEVDYASGSAQGEVMSASLNLAGYSVDSQYFIYAPDGNAGGNCDGLVGLGPASGSNIRGLGNTSASNPPLDRIFTSNSSVPPYIAILLQRSDDPAERYPGDLAIGQVLPNYTSILNQPKLPIALTSIEGGQHWQTFLDVDGVIANGQRVPIKTQVTGAQTENATIVFDTGFSLPQVSQDLAQAIYGGIPGAALTNDSSLGEVWTIPCNQMVNASFFFGGVEFPVHPLDLNSDEFNSGDDGSSQSTCIGLFQPYSFNITENGQFPFDMILGMGFLRNAYLLINFGNMVDAATPSTDTAYIQLLPVTNAAQAAQDFESIRNGNGNSDSTNSGSGSQLTTHSSSSGSFLKHGLVGVIIGVAVLLCVCVAGLMFSRRRRRMQNPPQPTAWAATAPTYRSIHEPSPQAAYDMHMAPGAQAGYAPPPGPPPVPEYRTAWDARY